MRNNESNVGEFFKTVGNSAQTVINQSMAKLNDERPNAAIYPLLV